MILIILIYSIQGKAMYGLINMAIKQLIIDNFGEEGWQSIRNDALVKENVFELLTPYEDAITYNLIQSACKFSKKSPSEILHLFGGYWIIYAENAGYGPLIQLFGPTYKECLLNLK